MILYVEVLEEPEIPVVMEVRALGNRELCPRSSQRRFVGQGGCVLGALRWSAGEQGGLPTLVSSSYS